jgi:prepilin-type N-terminal cleavage/methylation domain-containing protein
MKPQRGFTLIELAIVLVIVTILIGGLAVPLSAQIQARRIAETKQIMEEAREALIGYAMTHSVDHDADPSTPARPFLPCPDTNGNGLEEARTSGACPASVGRFPWATLGSAAQDAWGNRLLYAASLQLTNSTAGFSNGTAVVGHDVCSNRTCTLADVAQNVPVVVLSHGPNGWGARNVNGSTLAAPSGANEQENLDNDNRYVSRTPTGTDNANGEFDDLVSWLSFNVIITRVCPAGGCP